VFNATFNNISVISCRSVLLVEETGGPDKTTHIFELLYTDSNKYSEYHYYIFVFVEKINV
jgi:hypothetical protein